MVAGEWRSVLYLIIIQVQRSESSAPPDRLGEPLRARRRNPVEAKLQQPHGSVSPESMRQRPQPLVSNLVVAHVQITEISKEIIDHRQDKIQDRTMQGGAGWDTEQPNVEQRAWAMPCQLTREQDSCLLGSCSSLV